MASASAYNNFWCALFETANSRTCFLVARKPWRVYSGRFDTHHYTTVSSASLSVPPHTNCDLRVPKQPVICGATLFGCCHRHTHVTFHHDGTLPVNLQEMHLGHVV